MIAKISKGSTFSGIGRYLYSTGKNHEAHVNPRVVASGNVLVDDRREWRPWVADMRYTASLNSRVVKPVWHCSLSAAPEDVDTPDKLAALTDAKWREIAEQHVAQMGLAGHPWVAVRHGDNHIHIVASRVDDQGVVWRDSHDFRRVQTSMRRVERRHGLTAVDSGRPSGPRAKVTQNERTYAKNRTKATGAEVRPEREVLRERMVAALAQAERERKGVPGWEAALTANGIIFRASSTRDGRITGYSVSLSEWDDRAEQQVWLKASQVHRDLSWNRVVDRIGHVRGDRVAQKERAEQHRFAQLAEPTAAQLAEVVATAFGQPRERPDELASVPPELMRPARVEDPWTVRPLGTRSTPDLQERHATMRRFEREHQVDAGRLREQAAAQLAAVKAGAGGDQVAVLAHQRQVLAEAAAEWKKGTAAEAQARSARTQSGEQKTLAFALERRAADTSPVKLLAQGTSRGQLREQATQHRAQAAGFDRVVSDAEQAAARHREQARQLADQVAPEAARRHDHNPAKLHRTFLQEYPDRLAGALAADHQAALNTAGRAEDHANRATVAGAIASGVGSELAVRAQLAPEVAAAEDAARAQHAADSRTARLAQERARVARVARQPVATPTRPKPAPDPTRGQGRGA